MPRQARIDAPGALHHIMCRGMENRRIFRDDADRLSLLDRLGRIALDTSTSCFAWALMPNHFHLLLRTGNLAVSDVMRRLLTGYVVTFNRKHSRHGHLFQNRYKSILCQEDPYLLELVRYIHLNPLRANIVSTLKELDRYAFCGHSVMMGKRKNNWQDVAYISNLFGQNIFTARKRYHKFLEKGISLGKRKDLTGGGLIRSSGGWAALKDLRKEGIHFKSDERILGESDFVESVLSGQNEKFERRYQLKSQGYDLNKVIDRVSKLLEIDTEKILRPSKKPDRVKARSLVCYWAIRDLGIPGIEVGRKMGIVQSAVSYAVERGAKIANDGKFTLLE